MSSLVAMDHADENSHTMQSSADHNTRLVAKTPMPGA